MSFIFGGDTGQSYEELQRRRLLVDAMMAPRANAPQNVGEGLHAIGQALFGAMANRKVKREETEAKAASKDSFAKIIASLGGGYSGGMAPIGPVAGAQGGFSGAGYSGNPDTMNMAPAPAQGAPVAPAAGGPGGGVYEGLIARGIPEPVAQGFVMNFQDESGMNPGINEAAPIVPGSRGGFGLAQWTGPRRVALEQFAAQSGRPVDDPNTQLDFLTYELQGPESGAASKFMGATDPGQAAAGIAQHFLRPAPEHLERRVAQYTGGGDFMADALGAGGPNMDAISQIAELLGNPYADPGQQMVAQQLLQREFASGADALTPYQAAQLGMDQQRLALDRERMTVGNKGARGLNPIYVQENGKTVLYQPTTSGPPVRMELPDGATPLPGVGTIQTPTQAITIDKRSGETIRVDDKDLTGAAVQTGVGETIATAAAGLPRQAEALERITTAGDEIITDPVLEEVLGNWQGRLPPRTQAQANVQAKIDRFLGQTFPMAMQSLRGLGPASEREGMAAQAAIANLDQIQDPAQFTAAINEAIGHIRRGYEIAAQQAQGNVLPGTPAAEWPAWMNDDPTKWTDEQLKEAEGLIGGGN